MRRTGFALLALLMAAPALAQQGPPVPSITVEGEASAVVVPDTAILTIGVVTDAAHAADAAAQNAKAVQAVIDTVKAEGIDPRDVRTMDISLAPVFDQGTPINVDPHASPETRLPQIRGFRADDRLQVRVQPADRAGALLGKLIDKGVNAIEAVDFVSSTEARTREQLGADAVRDARHKAQLYVEALGLKLGPVLQITPGASAATGFSTRGRMMAASAARPTPLEAGSETLDATASVTWALQQ